MTGVEGAAATTGSVNASDARDPVLRIEDLVVDYRARSTTRRVLMGVDLTVSRGEVLGLVGESGCGKSTLASSILRLLPSSGRIVSGRIVLDGVGDVLQLDAEHLRRARGARAAMVMQDPMTSLNPTFRIGAQMVDVQAAHAPSRPGRRGRRALRERAIEALAQVGLPDPDRVFDSFPHQLSGGMRQRVVIATALTLEPELLIADEITSALDVTVQGQILDLVSDLQRRRDMSVLLVTHDLGVIAQACDRLAVMYAGQIVETGTVRDVFAHPQHPYTRALLGTIPQREHRKQPLVTIPGQVPLFSPDHVGCRFASRCEQCEEICSEATPALEPAGLTDVRCHLVASGARGEHGAGDRS